VRAPVEAESLPRAPALPHAWLHRLARRYLNPWVLRLGLAGRRWSPIGLVLSVGRRTGRSYATPLAVHRHEGQCFIPLTYGPNARWCLNVLAADGCRVRLRGREYAGTEPRVVRRGALPPTLRIAYRLIGMREFLALTVREPLPGGAEARLRRPLP
jgi:deazaflavin-dependent oxidoreductase (nitroreductase family)